MLGNTSEITIHRVRWIVTLGWCLLIISLFYDPLSTQLTEPSNAVSPFRLNMENCVLLQGKCIEEKPYGMGASIFWGIVVPTSILILFVSRIMCYLSLPLFQFFFCVVHPLKYRFPESPYLPSCKIKSRNNLYIFLKMYCIMVIHEMQDLSSYLLVYL